MFRLADVYLMYAESVVRGGEGGSTTTALGYVNALRERAYGSKDGDINCRMQILPKILFSMNVPVNFIWKAPAVQTLSVMASSLQPIICGSGKVA
jgi:hypothetical protein